MDDLFSHNWEHQITFLHHSYTAQQKNTEFFRIRGGERQRATLETEERIKIPNNVCFIQSVKVHLTSLLAQHTLLHYNRLLAWFISWETGRIVTHSYCRGTSAHGNWGLWQDEQVETRHLHCGVRQTSIFHKIPDPPSSGVFAPDFNMDSTSQL